MARTRLVRASEVGEYVFCNHAWWLHVVAGEQPGNVARRREGTRRHRAHGARVTLSNLLMLAAMIALVCGALVWLW